MKKYDKTQVNKNLDDALKESFSKDVPIDRIYKKNLDKLVDNTIKAKQIEEQKAYSTKIGSRKKGVFAMIFRGVKWQVAMISSLAIVLFGGGVVYAAVPSVRETVNEIFVPTKGTLSINSDPSSAKVLIRGGEYSEFTEVGETPWKARLKAGTYELLVSLEGYSDYEASVDLGSGEVRDFEVTLVEEESIVDRIKEWKTFTDLENGIEFTYPLTWMLEEDHRNGLLAKVTGDKSYFAVYRSEVKLPSEDKEEIINGKDKYMGWVDEDSKYRYTISESVSNETGEKTYTLLFGTKDLKELDIYQFILDSVAVFSTEQGGRKETDWLSFKQSKYGFSLKYPSSDWRIIEEQALVHFASYSLENVQGDNGEIQIIYSLGYWDGMNEYSYAGEDYVNSYTVDKYNSDQDKVLFQFPNRLFVILSDEDDETLRSILSSFEVTKEILYEEVFDYTMDYSINLPKGWTYETKLAEQDFEGRVYASIQNHRAALNIYKWEDIEEEWDEYIEKMNNGEIHYETKNIQIDENAYTAVQIWERKGSEYQLKAIVYNQYNSESYSLWGHAISLGENSYVVFLTGDIASSSYEDLDQDTEELFFQSEAIVTSLEPIQ